MAEDPLIDALADAVERDPAALVLRVHLAQLLFERGRYSEALIHCGTVLRTDPVDAAALQVMERCSVALTTQARWAEIKQPDGDPAGRAEVAATNRPDVAVMGRPEAGRGRHAAARPQRQSDPDDDTDHDDPRGHVLVAAGDPRPTEAAELTVLHGEATVERGLLVGALVDFTESGMDDLHVGPPSFTSAPEANRLLVEDAFAFLLGVLFDQSVPADLAWRTPYDLGERLGHLDPVRIAADPEAVRLAVGMTPKLHCFVAAMSESIVALARSVAEVYAGDAAAIWQGNPTARTVHVRLAELPGIGPTKAAMAVQMLTRDRGASIRDVSGSDLAYDTHARRVLLRTGLAQVDDLDHMQAVVRNADPTGGAGIALPAWKIGRIWCRAEIRWCESCPLREICPKGVAAQAVDNPRNRLPQRTAPRMSGDCA